MVSNAILSATKALRTALEGFDARVYSGDDAARVAEDLALTAKIMDGARAQTALRAAECDAHRDRGHANASEWIARQTGSSAGRARAELELAAHLDDNPELKDAVERGEVSLEEGEEIAKTEDECPGSTPEMLDAAKKGGLRGAKKHGRKKRQEAQDPDELAAKRRRARRLRTWDGDLGMICGQFALEPHIGIPFLKRLNAEIDRQWKAGDDAYRAEPRERRAADALVKLLEGTGKTSKTRPELVAVWNLNDDRAHLVGGGPIDHATLRELAKDAIVSLVLHDGDQVTDIKRYTRSYPVALRILLEIGPPPDFDGPICVDCGRHYHLQKDHPQAIVNGGITELDNIDWRCPHCHKAKTEQDLKQWRTEQGTAQTEQPTLTGRGPP